MQWFMPPPFTNNDHLAVTVPLRSDREGREKVGLVLRLSTLPVLKVMPCDVKRLYMLGHPASYYNFMFFSFYLFLCKPHVAVYSELNSVCHYEHRFIP